MRDIVADAAHLLHQPLDVVEHAVHRHRQLIQRIAGRVGRQPFMQIPLHNARDSSIDRCHTIERSPAREDTNSKRGNQRGRQPHSNARNTRSRNVAIS